MHGLLGQWWYHGLLGQWLYHGLLGQWLYHGLSAKLLMRRRGFRRCRSCWGCQIHGGEL